VNHLTYLTWGKKRWTPARERGLRRIECLDKGKNPGQMERRWTGGCFVSRGREGGEYGKERLMTPRKHFKKSRKNKVPQNIKYEKRKTRGDHLCSSRANGTVQNQGL